MNQQHTPEPWVATDYKIETRFSAEYGGSIYIASAMNIPNVHRIVACVNACEDILDYELSLGCVARLSEQLRTATKQRDELLDVLEMVCSKAHRGTVWLDIEEVDNIRAAIASVKAVMPLST